MRFGKRARRNLRVREIRRERENDRKLNRPNQAANGCKPNAKAASNISRLISRSGCTTPLPAFRKLRIVTQPDRARVAPLRSYPHAPALRVTERLPSARQPIEAAALPPHGRTRERPRICMQSLIPTLV